MVKIFIDKSGSMNELGKKDIVEIVLKSIIDDFTLKNIQYKVLDLDFNAIEEDSIIFTDGLFENSIDKGNVVSIGIDSDTSKIKKAFEVDEIMELLELYEADCENKNKEDDEDEW